MPDPVLSSTPPVAAMLQRWREFLEMAVTISKGSGGALWWVESSTSNPASPVLLTQHQLGTQPLDELHDQWPGHVESLHAVIQTLQSKTLDAQFEQSSGSQALRLLLIPIVSGPSVQLILELFLSQQGAVPVEQIESSIRQLLSWAAPASVSPTDPAAQDIATWLTHIHRSLEMDECCSTITNETRHWSKWDRVSLFVTKGQRLQLVSVSGVDVLDSRSSTVRVLEETANAFFDRSTPLCSSPSEPQPSLSEYQSRTQSQHVALFPLFGPVNSSRRNLLGMVLFDRFQGGREQVRSIDELQLACQHVAKALEHSVLYELSRESSLRRFSRNLFSTRHAKWAGILLSFFTLMVLLCVVPATLTVSGNGYLEPTQQQDIFALSNGLIKTLHVAPGEVVQAGQELITLRSPELEFESNRLQGELLTVRQQISDLEKLRTDPRRTAELRQSANELAARGEEFKTVETNLQQQIALLQKQADELSLRSPMTGEVITWNLKTLLTEDRPVARTDRLLRIADLQGDWRAKLYVDSRDMGPVMNAVTHQHAHITFLTAGAPDVSLSATLTEVSPVVTTSAVTGTTLTLMAQVPRDSIPMIRPGTTILFRIDCGKAPIGYVWFRRLIDRFQSWWTLL